VSNDALKLKHGQRVVFLGDSVTAAEPGYVGCIREMLESLHPELNVHIINSGRGSDNVLRLQLRVQQAVIHHDPEWVSISVGLNDCYYGPRVIAVAEFERRLDALVQTISANTRAQVVLCTPSILGEDPDGEDNLRLARYAGAVQRVAGKNGHLLVPVHEAFISALRRAKGTTDQPLFTTDGVHLNEAGNTLLGTTWLRAMGAFVDMLPGGV